MKQIILSAMLLICIGGTAMSQAECCTASGTFLTENYDTNAGWTFFDQGDGLNNTVNTTNCTANSTQNGGITINNGRLNFNSLRDAREVRFFRNMNATLNNTNWTADFTFTINPTGTGQLNTNIPGLYPVAFTSNNGPMQNGCVGVNNLNTPCPNYTWSNNNAIAVSLVSPFINSCGNSNPNATWSFMGFAKFGTVTYSSNAIPLTNATTYYIRLQRVTAGFVRISVFSDAGFCNHLPNSPQCFAISPNISGLSFLQHSNHTAGSWLRIFNGSVDNLRVDNGPSCGYLTATAGPDYLCSNSLSNFTLGSTANPTGPGYTYAWTPTTNVTGSSTGPTLNVTNNTTVTYTMNYTAGGCPFSDNVTVAAPVTVNAGPDVVNCNALMQSVPIGNPSNPSPPQQTYMWSSSNPNVTLGLAPSGTNGGATGIGASTIIVIATNQFGCTASDTLQYYSGANAGPDRFYCHYSPQGGVMIGGDYPDNTGYTYSWTASPSANAGIDCATCPRTIVNPIGSFGTVTYTLTVTLPNGQTCTDQVLVSIQNGNGYITATLPATYTVNCGNPGATTLTPTINSINAIANYVWNSMTTPSIGNLSSNTVQAPNFNNCSNGSNPATFFITVTDNAGCQASAKTVVTYNGFPPANRNGTVSGGVGSNGFVKGGGDNGQAQQEPKIFPSPNNGTFMVKSGTGQKIVKIRVRDNTGKLVKVLEHTYSAEVQVAIANVSSGVYFAEVWLHGKHKPVVQQVYIER